MLSLSFMEHAGSDLLGGGGGGGRNSQSLYSGYKPVGGVSMALHCAINNILCHS